MSLAKHVDPEELVKACLEHPHHKLTERENHDESAGVYSSRYNIKPLPKYKIPHQGVDADTAYQLIHDELELDGTPLLNLASFVHTWMPPQADKLFAENVSKNLIDEDEYKATVDLHHRCISMIAHLWKIPKGNKAIGTATTGSSEAIMLGGLALKRRWQQKRKAAGKDTSSPNIVMGANAQVALEKFARYFEVECRLVPVDEESRYCLSPKNAMKYVDENTIGVFVILGSTYTGHYENVLEMSTLLDAYQKETGIDVPIHVDAASGGFFAPFAHPDLKWDFSVPRVVSINTSGHKFGMVYAGVGWIIWKDEALLPKELIFELHYLGSTEYSFSLNFSRPAAPIIGQYFNLINLGFEGYRKIMIADLINARVLSRALDKSGYFEVLSDIHRPRDTYAQGTHGSTTSKLLDTAKTAVSDSNDPQRFIEGLPVVSFKFTKEFQAKHPKVAQRWIQTMLRVRGWIVPNYGLPPTLEKIDILRVVVRESMSEDMLDRLVVDICQVTEELIADQEGGGNSNILDSTSAKNHGRNDKLEKKATQFGQGSKDQIQDSVTYAKPC